ncbi:MAG: hypothetical protein RLZZ381_3656 [Cyanobacteriota bacterium]|jgi:hypothetical protein
MGIYPELDNLDLKDLIDYWHTTEPLDGEEYAASYYDELAFLIANKGAAGRLFLNEQISKRNNYKLDKCCVLLKIYTNLQCLTHK